MLDDVRRLLSQVKDAEKIGHQPIAVHPQEGIHRAEHNEVVEQKEIKQRGRAIREIQAKQ